MKLEEKLSIGTPRIMGTHTFQADEIITFATKYDPQPFHLSDEAAKATHFGKLCASGWHTAAVWMRCNVEDYACLNAELAKAGVHQLEFGPGSGLKNVRWPSPVFAGETISFSRLFSRVRALPGRPGWLLAGFTAEGNNAEGRSVLEFRSSILLRDIPA